MVKFPVSRLLWQQEREGQSVQDARGVWRDGHRLAEFLFEAGTFIDIEPVIERAEYDGSGWMVAMKNHVLPIVRLSSCTQNYLTD